MEVMQKMGHDERTAAQCKYNTKQAFCQGQVKGMITLQKSQCQQSLKMNMNDRFVFASIT